MAKRGLGAIPLTRSQVEYAIKTTNSAAAAARYLNVSYPTFKKYANRYDVFADSKNQCGKGISKAYNIHSGKYSVVDILEGKYPNYPLHRLKQRLISNAFLAERCDQCGFCEQRVSDFKVPLLLDFTSGDMTDWTLENLRLLCYNCFFLTVGNITGKKREFENPY